MEEMPRADSPFAEAARDYIERGWSVLPLRRGGKEPVTKRGLNDASDNPGQVDVWWGENAYGGSPWYNVGIACGAVSDGLCVIDLDCHGDGADGRETLRDWETANGRLPQTCEVETGSGGRHLLYRVSRPLRPSANSTMGVDIRCDGSYIVAPPSVHPNGEAYEWICSPDDMDVADADDAVYAFIDHVRPEQAHRERGERFELPGEVTANRNDTLFRYAASLRSTGRSAEEIAILVEAANRTRCKPPLGAAEVAKIVGSSTRYEQGDGLRDKRPEGGASVFDMPDDEAPKMKDETIGKIVDVLMGLTEVRDNLKFNVFDSRLHVMGPCVPGCRFDAPHVLTEGEGMNLMTAAEYGYGVRSKARYQDALTAIGGLESQRFDPMAAMLDSLPLVRWTDPALAGQTMALIEVSWDGGGTWEPSRAIAGSLTSRYLGTEPSTYSMEVEKLMFRQLVARARHPGCKADHMMVFVGRQGTGKSTFVRLLALAGDFFLEGFSNFDTEDLKRVVGKLVVEIPELDGFTGKDKNRIKSIITQTTDNYRESYARTSTEHLRTALFFGTTNDGAFLNDETGSRRYLVVESPKDALDADPGLFDGTAERDIRQAWAETVALYDLVGEGRFLRSLKLPPEASTEAAAVQQRYSEESTITTAVMSYIEGREEEARALMAAGRSCTQRVNVKEVMVRAMGYDNFRLTTCPKWIINSVTSTLNSCSQRGWTRLERARNGEYGSARAWDFDPRGVTLLGKIE